MSYEGSIVGREVVESLGFPIKFYVFKSYADHYKRSPDMKITTAAEFLLNEALLKNCEIINELHIFQQG